MNKQKKLIAGLTIMMLPILTLAKETIRPGTDDYLRWELKYTEQMLTEKFTTEEREKFDLAHGQEKIQDPLGDVLDRLGTTSTLKTAWGDIQSAELSQNTWEQAWEIRVELAEDVPQFLATRKAQLSVYLDSDGVADNNDYEGIGADTDREYSIRYNQENGWYTDFRWYNQEADFWAFDRKTEATLKILGRTMTLYVPFDEVPYDAAWRWRAVMALQDEEQTQIDVAPGTGFPPPLGGEYPKEPFLINWPKLSAGWMVLGAAGLMALIYGWWAALSGRMKNSDK